MLSTQAEFASSALAQSSSGHFPRPSTQVCRETLGRSNTDRETKIPIAQLWA
jgi:hypothetical protein